jgi:hypothetical protein
MVIQPGEKHTFTVERTFHISKAVMDMTSTGYSALTKLVVDCDEQKGITLCNIKGYDNQNHVFKAEADLDIFFQVGQRVTFYSEKIDPGMEHNPREKPIHSKIHLSGYVV